MSEQAQKKVGEIRPSHLIFGFGVGSLIDLPNFSAVVSGLDRWDVSSQETAIRLHEPRLLRAVQGLLGPQVMELIHPPYRNDDNERVPHEGYPTTEGIPVATFPRWLVCPQCRLLAPVDQFERELDNYNPSKCRYIHTNCTATGGSRRQPTVFPVRFLVTCKKGHLDDFPWLFFAHRGASNCQGPLFFQEFSPTSEARDIWVRCRGCNAEARPMLDAFGDRGRDVLRACTARHPHLRTVDEGGCTEEPKAILLGASNMWFPACASVLHIPRSSDDQENLIEEIAPHFSKVNSLADLAIAIETLEKARGFGLKLDAKVLDVLAGGIPLQKIWIVLERVRREADQPLSKMELKPPEYSTLIHPERAPKGRDFLIREARAAGKTRLPSQIKKVVLVERLREVKALTGFTRLEAPGELAEIDPEDRPSYVRLSKNRPSWVPAVEVRGEGVFIEFDEAAIREWQGRPAVQHLEERFLSAHMAWRTARQQLPAEEGFPGMRTILLHSISHALMRQISISCGYSAASLRERIYARDEQGDESAMAGILIYTSAPDSEGTLGGLVRAGHPDQLSQHFTFAMEEATFCGSDPLCAEHEPNEDSSLHGAACHSCLLAPETSCEYSNRYLDRSVLVKTLSSGAASTNFFQTPK